MLPVGFHCSCPAYCYERSSTVTAGQSCTFFSTLLIVFVFQLVNNDKNSGQTRLVLLLFVGLDKYNSNYNLCLGACFPGSATYALSLYGFLVDDV